MVNEQVKLLLVSVYMPYESDLVSTEEYTDQMMFVENILFNNSECHVIIAGEFNVDFSRSWPHTALLNSFCDNHGLIAADRHSKNTVDYTYQFNMERFCTLDHFLLSGTIFEEFVSSVSVSHDIDNLSDHEVITLQLWIEFVSFGAAERTFSVNINIRCLNI
jgi:endonuclease/exonuclease/phosphatase family metal-dependent hydrolase